jgi:hypothetical protein
VSHAPTVSLTISDIARGIVRNMTLDQKLGQMAIVEFYGPTLNADLMQMIQGNQVSGVLIENKNGNAQTRNQLITLNQGMQTAAHIPLFISTDFEGGYVNELRRITGERMSESEIGATGNTQVAYNAGHSAATDLAALGLNVNFMPIVDVLTNPNNPGLPMRTFGSDPTLVTNMGRAYLKGLTGGGIIGCLKHFPGLGSASIDPVWTPDGKRIVFKGADNRLFWQPADGSTGAEALTKSELAGNNVPGSWSPDGQVLTFMEINPDTGYDVFTLSLKDGKPQPFLRTPSLETAPRFSPDGHFIAYTSDESGRVEVYVRPYPGPGGKWQISTEGGMEPVWNPKGRELFYRSGKKMMAVEVTTQPTFSAGKPKVLFEGPYVPTPRSFPDYDVSPDGERFLMLKAGESEERTSTQINVVLNWFEELKQKVPAGKK